MQNTEQGVKIRLGVTVDPVATQKLDEIYDAAMRRARRVIQGVHDVDAGASTATKRALERNLKGLQHLSDEALNVIEQHGTKLSARVLARADKLTVSIANSVNEANRSLQNLGTGTGPGGGGVGIGRQILGAGLAIAGARSLASVVTETIATTEEYARIAGTLGQRYGGERVMWKSGMTGGRGWFTPHENLNLQGRMAAAAGTTDVGIQAGLVHTAETLTGALGLGDKGEIIADITEASRLAGVPAKDIKGVLDQIARNTGVAGEIAKANPQAFATAIVPVLQAMQHLGPISTSGLNAVIAETTMAYRTNPATAMNFPQHLANVMSNLPNLSMGRGDPLVTNAMFAAAREMYPNAEPQELAEIVSEASQELLARALKKAEQITPGMRSKFRALVLGPKIGFPLLGATQALTEWNIVAGRAPAGVGPAGTAADINALAAQNDTTQAMREAKAKSQRTLQELPVGEQLTPWKQLMQSEPWIQSALRLGQEAIATALLLKVGSASLRAAAPLLRAATPLLAPAALAGGATLAVGGAIDTALIYGAYKATTATGLDRWGGNLLYQGNRLFNPFSTDYESLRYSESMIGPNGYGGGVPKDRFESFMAALASNETGGVDPRKRYGKRGDQIIPGTAGERALGKYQMRLGTARQFSGRMGLTEEEFLGDADLQEATSRNYVRFLLSKHHGDFDESAKEWGGFRNADPTAYLEKLHTSMGTTPEGQQHIVVDLTPDAQKLLRIVNLQGRVPEMRVP